MVKDSLKGQVSFLSASITGNTLQKTTMKELLEKHKSLFDGPHGTEHWNLQFFLTIHISTQNTNKTANLIGFFSNSSNKFRKTEKPNTFL